MNDKKTYYIMVAQGEITQSATDSPWDFKIEATEAEIQELRGYFTNTNENDWVSFWRAHVPFLEYHHDQSNDRYDHTLQKVYGLIYELGDAEAKSHIEQMGVLK
nr:hydrolase [Cytobacillus eiseniae]